MSRNFEKVDGEAHLYIYNGMYFLRKQIGTGDTHVSLKTTKIGMARRLRNDYVAVKRSRALGLTAPEQTEDEIEEAQPLLCKAVFDRYVADDFPDGDGEPHSGDHLEAIKSHLVNLRIYFDDTAVNDVDQDDLDSYRKLRKSQVKKVRGNDGARTVDMELNTLSKCLEWAIRKKLHDDFKVNPIANRKKYRKSKDVLHCRDLRPDSIDGLHDILRHLFGHGSSECLAWQGLFEAMTGLRTAEILRWEMTLRGDVPGGLTSDGGSLCVRRARKGASGVDNPYLLVHPFLKECLEAHAKWHKQRYPKSKWFFPGLRSKTGLGNGGKFPVGLRALTHALGRLFRQKKISKHVTSHGLRALYVYIRRSQGADDTLIAHEIGHSSTTMIQRVYGSIPAHWRTGKGPNFSWRPSVKVAWSALS